MAKYRRDKGEGSIRKRSDGSWEARYSYIDEASGKRKYKSVYANSKTDVKDKLKDLIDKIENPPDPDEEALKKVSDITLGEWLDTWMTEYKKNSIRSTTYTGYHNAIEGHIRPGLGNMKLQKIRPEHIQKLLNDISAGKYTKTPLAPWTVLKAKAVLSGAFEQAIRNQIVPYNPVRATVPPKLEQKEIRVLTEDEQKQFMSAVKGHRLEALYLLALATGMRRGELLALTWDNVDFDNNTISVKASVSRAMDYDLGKSTLVKNDPKTKSGRRQVPILASMIPILKEHKERQNEEIREAGSAWVDNNLLFPSNVGTFTEPRRVNTTMDKITDAAGLPHFTFHSLRHTVATRMLEANISPKIVQDILGHADVTLTLNTYSHVIGTTAHEHMAKLDGLFKLDDNPEKKPGVRQQLADAKKEVKANQNRRDVSKTKTKNKNNIDR